MLGSDQAQRSNAVGLHTSYIPDADPGRQGGNTYTGASTEPTIQDYENFFGPSARDIKTDLQRFKRHGRWHLPDILKGPNPWLTDRIDGLITDATNSPFTTKILPYRYKDEVDGKIKWNVWNFDEGMASRVPYESAARTLQQSKRSFAGYMVRQGMAIVLEHNFMMTPKGRENFKNQLNQLIGSIQYTNDLDVHMALVLAPSYQKTMRERYYTLDKSPSQICREFVDLFGMMQKNVNALDILIEEGKAILRTWGGPMPDFLLCNSKLTFQMTMTPEKTNYITQGTDGVKRLRQGPDLGSYRGLSVIHSRSFAMEVGQHPRDILRRRVRTAEYYRILPDKNNVKREFEFYNEERDTWFTLTFQELLRYARYPHEGGGDDNPAAVDRVFNMLSNTASKRQPTIMANSRAPNLLAQRVGRSALIRRAVRPGRMQASLGARQQRGGLNDDEDEFIQATARAFVTMQGGQITNLFDFFTSDIENAEMVWIFTTPRFDLGIKHIYPRGNRVWDAWTDVFRQNLANIPQGLPESYVMNSLQTVPVLNTKLMRDLYHNLKNVTLNDPFAPGELAPPRTSAWYTAFAFYIEIYKRSGIPMGFFANCDIQTVANMDITYDNAAYQTIVDNLVLARPIPAINKVDITCQILNILGGVGSVNHPLFLQIDSAPFQQDRAGNEEAQGFAGRFLLTYEVIAPLLRQYNNNGKVQTGIEYIQSMVQQGDRRLRSMDRIFGVDVLGNNNIIENTENITPLLLNVINNLLGELQPTDESTHDIVYLARNGISTIPLGVTSISHILHPRCTTDALTQFKLALNDSFGHLNVNAVHTLSALQDNVASPTIWTNSNLLRTYGGPGLNFRNFNDVSEFWKALGRRLTEDPVITHPRFNDLVGSNYLESMPYVANEFQYLQDVQNPVEGPVVFRIAEQGLAPISIDIGRNFTDPDPPTVPREATVIQEDTDSLQDVEIVIIRPNIEHNMLGVIMGLGGETLGNTLWGQTELSVYDDSMHGIWGMSYKYHERAIVFNEKNLIRLWDIAYDGYNGGKDDTHVDWLNPDAPNGYQQFKELTLDVSKNYRGPSMMVMAFVHNKDRRDDEGVALYDKHFRRNWPSPIIFHDSRAGTAQHGANKETLPVDYDNLQVIDVDEFRVFNNPLYASSYSQYRALMPHFHEMHMMRKTAGQSSADSETHTDSLAFQGSMKIKENGTIMQEIHGSGHHGPDYTGVASVRAGKGQKTAGQAPTLHRLI